MRLSNNCQDRNTNGIRFKREDSLSKRYRAVYPRIAGFVCDRVSYLPNADSKFVGVICYLLFPSSRELESGVRENSAEFVRVHPVSCHFLPVDKVSDAVRRFPQANPWWQFSVASSVPITGLSHFCEYPFLAALGVVYWRGTFPVLASQSSGNPEKPTPSPMAAWHRNSGIGITCCVGLLHRSIRCLSRLVGFVADRWRGPGDRRGAGFIGQPIRSVLQACSLRRFDQLPTLFVALANPFLHEDC